MALTGARHWLTPPVDDASDHVLGSRDARIVVLEFGSYISQPCRLANERIAELRDEYGDRLRYVFRHAPVPGLDLAQRAAELAERAAAIGKFWEAHMALMTRSPTLTEEDLEAVTNQLGLDPDDRHAAERARAKVSADSASAAASGVLITPTFYINGRKYEGLWEEAAFSDALVGSLGHRMRAAALDFARWAPSAGVLLLLATVLAVLLTNSPLGPAFQAFWEHPFGISLGDDHFTLSLLRWVNEGLLSIFFLVVGLEIKREFTVGHLATRQSAALPVAAAIGGMVIPVGLYLLVLPSGPWTVGWGVPMATDTAFAIALIIMMGSRVPVELRIYLTAATIVDDIGAILVVAIFYSHGLHLGYLGLALAITGVMALLNRMSVYRLGPYLLLGVALWGALNAGGLHATLAGVLLALFIPTRDPPNIRALMAQADAILMAEARRSSEVLHFGPSAPAMSKLDAIHDRLESPADRLLRVVSVRSSYVVLPVFALANAGVVMGLGVLSGYGPLVLAVVAGLVLGKPIGMLGASTLAVRLGLATKPAEYSWIQLAGAGALSGIGFTMSLFIAGEAFPDPGEFAAVKIAVFTASGLAGVFGVLILWYAGARDAAREAGEDSREGAEGVASS